MEKDMTETDLKRAIDTKKQMDNLEVFIAICEKYENVGLSILLGNKDSALSSCRLLCDRSIKRIKSVLKDELEVTKHEFEKM